MPVIIGRRELIAAFGGTAAAWPLGARAQQPRKIYRVGLLVTGAPMGATDKRQQTLLSVLAAHGFVDGQNLVSVQRSADAHPERLDGLVAELKAAHVDVIVTHTDRHKRRGRSGRDRPGRRGGAARRQHHRRDGTIDRAPL